MFPDPDLLVAPTPNGRIRPDGRAEPDLRAELRRIPSFRNVLSVVSVWVQVVGPVVLATWWGNPLGWMAVFVLFGRSHAQLAALMHEAAHRLLFRNRRANDVVGRWLLGYPTFSAPDPYRRGHMAHHRQEFGPDEPDIPLYIGYPISRDSMRRKLVRDATGQTGWKLLKAQLRGLRSPERRTRRTVWSILAVQAVMAAVCIASGYWFVYVLWFASYMTVWRVINRLRSIAEHGGLGASDDRRQTTHTVRQTWPARFLVTPYHIGWHLAHHVDSGVPWRNLPRFHRELVAAGYITPGLEYPSYTALWRKLSSRP
jgi:fatty acid desaturase